MKIVEGEFLGKFRKGSCQRIDLESVCVCMYVRVLLCVCACLKWCLECLDSDGCLLFLSFKHHRRWNSKDVLQILVWNYLGDLVCVCQRPTHICSALVRITSLHLRVMNTALRRKSVLSPKDFTIGMVGAGGCCCIVLVLIGSQCVSYCQSKIYKIRVFFYIFSEGRILF